MGIFFRKSLRLDPLRFTLSRRVRLGVSGGVRGLRVSLGSRGASLAPAAQGNPYRKRLDARSGDPAGLGPVSSAEGYRGSRALGIEAAGLPIDLTAFHSQSTGG